MFGGRGDVAGARKVPFSRVILEVGEIVRAVRTLALYKTQQMSV